MIQKCGSSDLNKYLTKIKEIVSGKHSSLFCRDCQRQREKTFCCTEQRENEEKMFFVEKVFIDQD
jgi:hypothetical protein